MKGINLMTGLLTVDREKSGFANATTGDILCNATVIAHVGKSGLCNEQMAIRSDDIIGVSFWVDSLSIAYPGNNGYRNPNGWNASQLCLGIQLNAFPVRSLLKVSLQIWKYKNPETRDKINDIFKSIEYKVLFVMAQYYTLF